VTSTLSEVPPFGAVTSFRSRVEFKRGLDEMPAKKIGAGNCSSTMVEESPLGKKTVVKGVADAIDPVGYILHPC
jgi:hypothetical protein